MQLKAETCKLHKTEGSIEADGVSKLLEEALGDLLRLASEPANLPE
jgi:hypothetical protein